MNVFLSTLTTFSALILVIILFTSDYKRSDKTWKSFSAMVLFYFAYDILILLRSLSRKLQNSKCVKLYAGNTV